MGNITLHKVEDPKVAFLCVNGEHEVQRGVVPINQLRALPPLRDDPFQVIAKRVWALSDLLKYAIYHAFLSFLADLWVLVIVASVLGSTDRRQTWESSGRRHAQCYAKYEVA